MQCFNRICHKIYAAQVKEDIPPGLQSHVFEMRISGFWPTVDDSRYYKWLTIGMFLFVGVIFPLSLFVNMFFVASVLEAINHFFLSMTHSSTIFKMCIIYWQRERIRELFRINVGLSHGAEYTNQIARTNVRLHTLFTLLYGGSCCGLITQSILSRRGEGVLPSTSLYPFDFVQRREIYSIFLVYQCFSNTCCALLATTPEGFYVGLMNQACGHLIDLKNRLKNLGTQINGHNADRDAVFYRDAIDCCKRYEHCLR